MRILHVYHIYPALFGGVSRVVHDITRELYSKGHDVAVLTTDNYSTNIKSIQIENNNGIDVYRVPTLLKMFTRKNNIILPHPSLVYLVKRIIERFDIIHFHGHRAFPKIVSYYYAKKYHIPYVVEAHGDLPRIMAKKRLKRCYDVVFGYKILRDASKVIALNQTEAKQYRCMGVSEEKIVIVPNGIYLSEYANLPPRGAFKRKVAIPEDKKIILYLGRINKIKGIDFLVKAYAYLIKNMKYDDAVLVIVGPDDGYLSTVKLLVNQLELQNRVLLTGSLYGKSKFQAYVDADVYVLPSRYETFPMSLLEAYACGKSVVTSRIGGLKDLVVDGITGYSVKVGDIKMMAHRIFSLLNDEDESEKMGLKGKEFVGENFAIEKVVDRLEQVYTEAARR